MRAIGQQLESGRGERERESRFLTAHISTKTGHSVPFEVKKEKRDNQVN